MTRQKVSQSSNGDGNHGDDYDGSDEEQILAISVLAFKVDNDNGGSGRINGVTLGHHRNGEVEMSYLLT